MFGSLRVPHPKTFILIESYYIDLYESFSVLFSKHIFTFVSLILSSFDTEIIPTWPDNRGISCNLRNYKAFKSGLLSNSKVFSTQSNSTNAGVLWKVTGFGCGPNLSRVGAKCETICWSQQVLLSVPSPDQTWILPMLRLSAPTPGWEV